MLPLELLHGEEDIEDDIDDIGEGIITDDDDDPVDDKETESWPTKEAAVEAVSIPEEAILSNLELAMLITLGRWL